MLGALTHQLAAGGRLSADQTDVAVRCLIDEGLAAELKADFLGALARKGETANEIAAFARALRGVSVQPPLDAELRQRA